MVLSQGLAQKNQALDYDETVAPFERQLNTEGSSVSRLLSKVNTRLEKYVAAHDTVRIIHLLIYKTRLEQSFQKSNKANESATQLLSISNRTTETYSKAEGLSGYAVYLQNLGKIDSALHYLDLAKTLDMDAFPDLKKDIEFEIIRCQMRNGRYKKALGLLDIHQRRWPKTAKGLEVTILKGIALESLGQPDKALELLLEAKRKLEDQHHNISLIKINIQIANLLQNLSLYSEAFEYYKQVERQSKIYGHQTNLASLHNSLGEILLKTGNFLEAQRHLLTGIELLKASYTEPYGILHINLSHSYSMTGKFERATKQMEKAAIFFKENNFQRGLLLVEIEKARLALRRNNSGLARSLLENVLQKFETSDIPRYQINTRELYVEVLQAEGDYKEAFFQQRKNDALKNKTLGSKQAIVKVTRLLTNYDDAHGSISEKWIYFGGIFSMSLLAFVLYRKKYPKKKKSKGPRNSLKSETEIQELKNALNFQLHTKKLYLKEDLSLQLLSETIGTTDKKLSYLINTILDSSFYEIVNECRLLEFESLVATKKYKDYSLQGLIEMSGFSSKTVFYRVFKEKHGMTPKMYLNQN